MLPKWIAQHKKEYPKRMRKKPNRTIWDQHEFHTDIQIHAMNQVSTRTASIVRSKRMVCVWWMSFKLHDFPFKQYNHLISWNLIRRAKAVAKNPWDLEFLMYVKSNSTQLKCTFDVVQIQARAVQVFAHWSREIWRAENEHTHSIWLKLRWRTSHRQHW